MKFGSHQKRRFTVAAAAAVGLVAALPAAASAAPLPSPEGSGAPKKAEVRMQSLFGVPPDGYSLTCGGLSGCTKSGNIDLATTATVNVSRNRAKGDARGTGPLTYTKTEGDVTQIFTCEGAEDPFVSEVEVTGTRAGELEIADVEAAPGSNALAVTLNHGGDTGSEFPQEITERSDGGCGSPFQDLTQRMGQWYYHFYFAHRDSQQQIGNDLEIDGLKWDGEAYSRVFDRFVTLGVGSNTYLTYEQTRLEVVPEFCRGRQNQISSAVADGESLGLGPAFYEGQIVSAPPKTKIRLGDGSAIELEEGGTFEIKDCGVDETEVFLGGSLNSFWVYVKKAVAGSPKKFEVVTERAVAGVRGTIFEVRYDEAKEITRVAVEESSVSLKGRNGAKGEVIVKRGQVGMQKGTKAPRLVKR